MVIQAGDGQIGLVGSGVAAAPAMRITDAFTNPVGGVSVTFSVTGGGGNVNGAAPTTDGNGVAAKMDGTSAVPCVGVMPTVGALPQATRDIVRAWIRNGAPNN